jgi:hypothetical protein
MSNQEDSFEYHLMTRLVTAAKYLTGSPVQFIFQNQGDVRYLGNLLLNTWYVASPYVEELKSIAVCQPGQHEH